MAKGFGWDPNSKCKKKQGTHASLRGFRVSGLGSYRAWGSFCESNLSLGGFVPYAFLTANLPCTKDCLAFCFMFRSLALSLSLSISRYLSLSLSLSLSLTGSLSLSLSLLSLSVRLYASIQTIIVSGVQPHKGRLNIHGTAM